MSDPKHPHHEASAKPVGKVAHSPATGNTTPNTASNSPYTTAAINNMAAHPGISVAEMIDPGQMTMQGGSAKITGIGSKTVGHDTLQAYGDFYKQKANDALEHHPVIKSALKALALGASAGVASAPIANFAASLVAVGVFSSVFLNDVLGGSPSNVGAKPVSKGPSYHK